MKGNTILITGGASGVGLGLTERLVQDNTVIICGRQQERLAQVKAKFPSVSFRVCDIARPEERIELFHWAITEFPSLNILINNAGSIRRDLSFTDSSPDVSWQEIAQEFSVNLEAPVHLCKLFVSHFKAQKNPIIINVTSGLSFTPVAQLPVYCAAKAAMHSFTQSMRHQLAPCNIKVVELIPPPLNTGSQETPTSVIPLDEFLNYAIPELNKGSVEIAYEFSKKTSQASRAELDQVFAELNPVKKYDKLDDFHGL